MACVTLVDPSKYNLLSYFLKPFGHAILVLGAILVA
jgi:hypothetical protein